MFDVMTIQEDDDDTDVREVWNDLQEAKDPMDREFLLVRLAEYALRTHDFSDLEICDGIHEQFAALRLAQEKYHLAALSAGRFVAHMMESDEILRTRTQEDNAN